MVCMCVGCGGVTWVGSEFLYAYKTSDHVSLP